MKWSLTMWGVSIVLILLICAGYNNGEEDTKTHHDRALIPGHSCDLSRQEIYGWIWLIYSYMLGLTRLKDNSDLTKRQQT